MKNYLEFERDIKDLEEELEKLKDPFNKEGLSEVETHKISKIQSQIDEKLRISYLNADLHMTKEECVDVSPVHNLPKFMPPTVVAVGGGETDEFRRQSRIYTDKCREHGFDVSYLEVENHDHVNVVGELRNLNSPLTSALIYQMGL